MSEQPGRFGNAIEAVRRAMEMLENNPEAVEFHQAGELWVVWAHYGDQHPEALVILTAPDAPETVAGGQGITSAVLRKVPLGEITAEGRHLSTFMDAEAVRR